MKKDEVVLIGNGFWETIGGLGTYQAFITAINEIGVGYKERIYKEFLSIEQPKEFVLLSYEFPFILNKGVVDYKKAQGNLGFLFPRAFEIILIRRICRYTKTPWKLLTVQRRGGMGGDYRDFTRSICW